MSVFACVCVCVCACVCVCMFVQMCVCIYMQVCLCVNVFLELAGLHEALVTCTHIYKCTHTCIRTYNVLASFPGAKGVRSAHGFHCLRMRVIIVPLAWERGSIGKEQIRAIAEVTWTTLFPATIDVL